MKIQIVPIKLEHQSPTEVQECYVELLDDRMVYHIRFFADEPVDENDKSLGTKNVFNAFKTVAMKSHIAGFEKTYTTSKKWGVYIMIIGFASDIKVFFKKEEEATDFFEKINTWI